MSVDRRDDTTESNGGEDIETETVENQDELELGPKEYLGYWVLREREETGGQPISRSVFWKLCCLADRRLKNEYEHDIQFPRHWYKYGEVGEAHSLTRDFFNAPQARFWQGQEYHTKEIPETAFDVGNEERVLIHRAARETVEEYYDLGAQGLKEVQYREFAPNDFIQSYSRLRKHLGSLDEVEAENSRQTGIGDYMDSGQRNYIEQLLDDMITTYPREIYSDIYRLYLRWDDTMRMLVEQQRSVHEQKVFLEFFVEKLSEITLRFEHNNAIPEEKLEEWYQERDAHINELNDGIEETRQECLSRREMSGELEAISEIYDKVVIDQI